MGLQELYKNTDAMFSIQKTCGIMYKDKLTVDYLYSSYSDYQQIVEELALSEIHSLELAMPRFNTLATLNRTEFNKFMANLKGKYKEAKSLTVMVAAITDTFTCMISNNKFYESFASDTKGGLKLLINLLLNVTDLITHCRGIKSKELPTFIGILEKSAERIRNDNEHYKIMQEIIVTLKAHMSKQSEKENTIEVPKEEFKVDCQVKNNNKPQTFIHNFFNSENSELPPSSLSMNKKLKLNDHCIMDDDKSPALKPLENKAVSPTINKKPTNAFELMMKSSKMITTKRKCTF